VPIPTVDEVAAAVRRHLGITATHVRRQAEVVRTAEVDAVPRHVTMVTGADGVCAESSGRRTVQSEPKESS
jgi:hypothetical protein